MHLAQSHVAVAGSEELELPSRLLHIRAALFDMDGLLVDSEEVYFHAWRDALREQGLEITADFYFENFAGRRTAECDEILCARFGEQLNIFLYRERWPELWTKLIPEGRLALKAGAKELLDYLRGVSMPLALATSSDRSAVAASLSPEVLAAFSAVVTSDDLPRGRGKPRPDIFLCAAERLNLPPEACAVFEDSEAGIRAAHAAGAVPVLIPDRRLPSPEAAALACLIAPSLQSVHALFVAARTPVSA